MKRASPRPIRLQLLNRILQSLLPLPLKILRSHIGNSIPIRIILVTVITGQRPTERPGQPSSGTPAGPERGLHVVRRGVPLSEEDSIVLVWVFGDAHCAEEVWAGEGEVAEDETAGGEEGGEEG